MRAAAVLAGPGIVAVVTAGPARLGLLPMGGGEARVVEIAVESPQEVALLSPDLAVVRAGDGHLFGLFELRGTVRARIVGRDARALCMRPSGETALAIHQDGSATSLTAGRTEIGARSINLRGTLRACDVGENVTYVVLDGEGGGQFRIHPGPTPELGTSAKTTLPAEAKELDQVRGGPALSAIWKRGVASLCVVTGSPGRLSARMVAIDARPAEVAVVDDSLLVAFADGRPRPVRRRDPRRRGRRAHGGAEPGHPGLAREAPDRPRHHQGRARLVDRDDRRRGVPRRAPSRGRAHGSTGAAPAAPRPCRLRTRGGSRASASAARGPARRGPRGSTAGADRGRSARVRGA